MYARIENGAIVDWATFIPPTPDGEEPKDYRQLIEEWPLFDRSTHQVGDPTDTLEADKVRRTWVVYPRALTKQQLADYAADKRWRVASGGITVTVGGNSISLPSDDVAYGRLKGAAQDLTAGIITEPITIVLGLTKITATQQTAAALYAAISQHWQACYAVQGTVVDGINAETITTIEQIDAAAWPA